jgi:8-oxo-dGTP diphosphatase
MPQPAKVEVVAGVVIFQHGKVLLVQEKQPKVYGKWNFPAGHVDEGETIEEAAIRETKEEVGYDVELDTALPVLHESIDRPVLHAFTAHITGGELRFPEAELLDAQWFTPTEIRTMAAELRTAAYILGAVDMLYPEHD